MAKNWLDSRYIAHRGLHTETITENTLDAFKNAIDHGYNIELDVQPTIDNVVMVYHDTNLGRLTNCKEFLENLTFDYIDKTVRYTATGAKLPLFKDVLKLCEGKTGLMIEIKKQTYYTPEIRVEPLVYEMLKDYKGEFVVKSFNPFSVKWFIDHAPNFKIGLLCEYGSLDEYDLYDKESKPLIEELLFTGERKVDFFDYCVGKIGSPMWNMVHDKMPCYTWVVRSQETQDSLKDKGVANIIFENYIPKKESK